ncbi:MAG TPA: acyl-CoA dehydrogenase family protein [Gaiellales bacterium]|jgi:alkylation response protein AidB-like acyl-CoA dehydrogenase|nr:acyl-CoA dehydrogenase family protein [Gaiellales bacterium]
MSVRHPQSEEQELLVEAVRTLAREQIAPHAAEVDKRAEFPFGAVALLRQNDVFALAFAEEYGGTGTGTLTFLRAVEELSYADATVGLVLAVQSLGAIAIELAGSPEQKQRYLPRWASGEWISAYALTEAGSGSDARAMRTTARREGGEWVIDGSKRFITNAGVADTYVVFARTEDSISAFMVEKDAPGFSVARIEPKMGIKGSTTGELLFEGCRVPADAIVGDEGTGFRTAMRVLDRSRPGIGAQALGIAQAALDYALRYAEERETFGKPLADHQGIQFMLADMAVKVEASRGLLYDVGVMLDQGIDGSELTRASAMAKLMCSDTAMSVTTDAVQILGGYGYIEEYPVERMMRDAKITQIYEGANQIQRLVIARELRRGAGS